MTSAKPGPATPSRCGVDEAGRGPILGPMVVAGVRLSAEVEQELREAGVKDSKLFATPKARERRETLAGLVREKAARVAVRVIGPERIDRENLGDLEREAAVSILEELAPDGEIVMDGVALFAPLRARFPRLLAENGADGRHTVVAAASIIAKVERNNLFLEIARRYEPEFGPIEGWGYVNPGTSAFLEAYRARYGDWPPEARRKWTRRAPEEAR